MAAQQLESNVVIYEEFMNTSVISAEVANLLISTLTYYDLLSNHDVFYPIEQDNRLRKFLVFPEVVNWDTSIEIVQLIPTGTEEISGMIFCEDVKISGTLSNTIHPDPKFGGGMNVFFLKNLAARSLITTNATVFVAQSLNLEEVAYLFYDNGTSELCVNGTLRAKGLIVNDEHRCQIEEFDLIYDLDAYNDCASAMEAALRPEYLDPKHPDEDYRIINHEALEKAIELGHHIFNN